MGEVKNCPRCSKMVREVYEFREGTRKGQRNVLIEHEMKENVGEYLEINGPEVHRFVSYSCVNCGYTELYKQ